MCRHYCSIATGILGMKAILTSDLLPLLNGHFNIYLCMCRLLIKLTQYVILFIVILQYIIRQHNNNRVNLYCYMFQLMRVIIRLIL